MGDEFPRLNLFQIANDLLLIPEGIEDITVNINKACLYHGKELVVDFLINCKTEDAVIAGYHHDEPRIFNREPKHLPKYDIQIQTRCVRSLDVYLPGRCFVDLIIVFLFEDIICPPNGVNKSFTQFREGWADVCYNSAYQNFPVYVVGSDKPEIIKGSLIRRNRT